MDSKFLALQGSYKQLQIALFHNTRLIEKIVEEGSRSSAMLIPHINTLLQNNQFDLTALNFIVIDQGPGAFTSLRVTISSVNALAYALKIPLIGIDGLDALAEQTQKLPDHQYVVLLNAFNQEVFYGIYDSKGSVLEPKGYLPIEKLLTHLKTTYRKICFVGNGAHLFAEKIKKEFSEATILPDDMATAQTIGRMGFELWNKETQKTTKLLPLYMKLQTYAIKT